ncbi:hypothetical protein B0H17DRAFT_1147989 [Mycena rosella]|uniref:Uncharacterized protein n=1 Tax=Mycena rosella TaxID=1033263 RepID=A0AAD7CGZ5_MYCRO|nr:hypothetical protein B0H17DRAFT_1147989 [Mycena rosella]
MLCGIPNISVVEYGGGWRVTEATEAAEVEETSIPGGGWRATEAVEAAEVEETSIPVSILSTEHTKYVDSLKPSIPDTFHGTAGGGWRVMEAAEVAEVEEISIPGGGWRAMEAAEVAERVELYVKI